MYVEHTYAHVYMYICIYAYVYMCIYVYMYICIYVYMYICIYVKHIYIYIHIKYVCTHTHICRYIHHILICYINIHVCVHMLIFFLVESCRRGSRSCLLAAGAPRSTSSGLSFLEKRGMRYSVEAVFKLW